MKKDSRRRDSRDARDSRAKEQEDEKAQAKLPLPQPMDLATLAAILLPSGEQNAALKKVMEFYVEAVFCVREWPATFAELVAKFGSPARRPSYSKLVGEYFEARDNDTLELDMKKEKDHDEAREFVAECGHPLKQARSVIDLLRRHHSSVASASDPEKSRLPQKSWKELLREIGRNEDGSRLHWRLETPDSFPRYAIPKAMLEDAVKYARAERSETKRKAWKKRRQ